ETVKLSESCTNVAFSSKSPLPTFESQYKYHLVIDADTALLNGLTQIGKTFPSSKNIGNIGLYEFDLSKSNLPSRLRSEASLSTHVLPPFDSQLPLSSQTQYCQPKVINKKGN